MTDNTQQTPDDATVPQDQDGPTENEMPDAEAIEKRIESGTDRKDAEAAFGGQAEEPKAQ